MNTLILSGVAFLLYIPLALIPAAIQAMNRDRTVDHVLSVLTLVFVSMPEFLLGTLMLIVFVIAIPVLPATSVVVESSTFAEWVEALVLPSVTLAIVMAVYAVRMLRDNLIEVLESHYIRMAELKGLPRHLVMLRPRRDERARPDAQHHRAQYFLPHRRGWSFWRRCSDFPASAACSSTPCCCATSPSSKRRC